LTAADEWPNDEHGSLALANDTFCANAVALKVGTTEVPRKPKKF